MKASASILRLRWPTGAMVLAVLQMLLVMPGGVWAQTEKEPAPIVFLPSVHLGPVAENPNSPSLAVSPEGRLYAIWVADDPRASSASGSVAAGAGTGSHMGMDMQHMHMKLPGSGWPGHTRGAAAYLAFSANGGKTWSTPRFVNRKPSNVLGWEEPPRIGFGSGGKLYAVWDSIGSKNYFRDNVNLAWQMEDGRFTMPVTVNNAPNEARFGALGVSPDGSVFVAWIDRRATPPATRALYLSQYTADGKLLRSNVRIGEPTCQCCRVTMAFGDGGRNVYIAYREDRDDIRDIVVQASTNGGRTFGPPVVVSNDHWHVAVCPEAGPVVATDAAGRVYVTYFTGKPGMAGVYYAVSRDAGQTFGPHHLLDARRGPAMLHSYLAVDTRGNIYAAWDDFPKGQSTTEIYFRHIAADGTMSPIQQLSHAKGNAYRPSIALTDSQVYVAWTASNDGQSTVVMRAGVLR